MRLLGVLRPGLYADYDRIGEFANQYPTVRQMLGHGDWTEERVTRTLNGGLPKEVPPFKDLAASCCVVWARLRVSRRNRRLHRNSACVAGGPWS